MKNELVTLKLVMALLMLPALVSATISVNDPWVEIHSNSADTETFTIDVSGLGWFEDANVTVEVDGHKVTNALGEPTTVNGGLTLFSASARFKPAQNTYTGRATIRVTAASGNQTPFITSAATAADEGKGLTFENVIKDTATAAGRTITFVVHYTNQSLDVVTNNPVTPSQALDIMTSTYERHVVRHTHDLL